VLSVWRWTQGLGPCRQSMGGACKVVRKLSISGHQEGQGLHQLRCPQQQGTSGRTHHCHGWPQVRNCAENANSNLSAHIDKKKISVISSREEVGSMKCRLCHVQDINCVNLPCGHMSTCVSCLKKENKCSVCSKVKSAYIEVFL
jgi:hypothetical protein